VDPTSAGVDIVLGLGALATLVSLIRNWRSLWDDDLTSADRLLAAQIGVFLLPPVVVLLHELGHALVAWLVGARVVGFSYRLFEGSVTAVGFITPGEGWSIAVAGNVVSAVAGLGLLVVGAVATRLRRPVRYVLIVAGMVELVFALVAYPLISLASSFGDWAAIYDFSETPVLSGATALVHVGLLLGLWRWWQSGGRRTLFALAHGDDERLTALEQAIREDPSDCGARIDLANLFAGHGDLGLAKTTLDQATRSCGGQARLHLARARLALHQGRWNDAMIAARQGLDAPETSEEVRQRLWANEGLALAQMQRPVNALSALENVTEPMSSDLRVRYARGVARLGAGDPDGGREDLEAVVERLPPGDSLRGWAEVRLQGESPPTAPMAGV
jgi:hypothetical protein